MHPGGCWRPVAISLVGWSVIRAASARLPASLIADYWLVQQRPGLGRSLPPARDLRFLVVGTCAPSLLP